MNPKQIADAIIEFRAGQRSKKNISNSFFMMLDLEQRRNLIDAIETYRKENRIDLFGEDFLQDEKFKTEFSMLMTAKAGMLPLEDNEALLAVQEDFAGSYACTLPQDDTAERAVYGIQFNTMMRRQADLLTAQSPEDCCRFAADILLTCRNMKRIIFGLDVTPAFYTMNNEKDHKAIVQALNKRCKTAEDIQNLKKRIQSGSSLSELYESLQKELKLTPDLDCLKANQDYLFKKHEQSFIAPQPNFGNNAMYAGRLNEYDNIQTQSYYMEILEQAVSFYNPNLLNDFYTRNPQFRFSDFAKSEKVRLCKKIAADVRKRENAILLGNITIENEAASFGDPTTFHPYEDLLSSCSKLEIMLIMQHFDHSVHPDVPEQTDAELIRRNRQLIKEVHNNPQFRNQLLSDAISNMQALDPKSVFSPNYHQRFLYISQNINALSAAHYIHEIRNYIENPVNGFSNKAQIEDLSFGGGVYEAYDYAVNNAIKRGEPLYAVLTDMLHGEADIHEVTGFHDVSYKFRGGDSAAIMSQVAGAIGDNFTTMGFSPETDVETKPIELMMKFFTAQNPEKDLRPSRFKSGNGTIYADLIHDYINENPDKKPLEKFMEENDIQFSDNLQQTEEKPEAYFQGNTSELFTEAQVDPIEEYARQQIKRGLSLAEQYESLRRFLQISHPDKLESFDAKNPGLLNGVDYIKRFENDPAVKDRRSILEITAKYLRPENNPVLKKFEREFPIAAITKLAKFDQSIPNGKGIPADQRELMHTRITNQRKPLLKDAASMLAFLYKGDLRDPSLLPEMDQLKITGNNRNMLANVISNPALRNEYIKEIILDIQNLEPAKIFSGNVRERQAYMMEHNKALAFCCQIDIISDYINDPDNGFSDPKLIQEFNFAKNVYRVYGDRLQKTCRESHPLYEFITQISGGENQYYHNFGPDNRNPNNEARQLIVNTMQLAFIDQGIAEMYSNPDADGDSSSEDIATMTEFFSAFSDINSVIKSDIVTESSQYDLDELIRSYVINEEKKPFALYAQTEIEFRNNADFLNDFVTKFNEDAKSDAMYKHTEPEGTNLSSGEEYGEIRNNFAFDTSLNASNLSKMEAVIQQPMPFAQNETEIADPFAQNEPEQAEPLAQNETEKPDKSSGEQNEAENEKEQQGLDSSFITVQENDSDISFKTMKSDEDEKEEEEEEEKEKDSDEIAFAGEDLQEGDRSELKDLVEEMRELKEPESEGDEEHKAEEDPENNEEPQENIENPDKSYEVQNEAENEKEQRDLDSSFITVQDNDPDSSFKSMKSDEDEKEEEKDSDEIAFAGEDLQEGDRSELKDLVEEMREPKKPESEGDEERKAEEDPENIEKPQENSENPDKSSEVQNDTGKNEEKKEEIQKKADSAQNEFEKAEPLPENELEQAEHLAEIEPEKAEHLVQNEVENPDKSSEVLQDSIRNESNIIEIDTSLEQYGNPGKTEPDILGYSRKSPRLSELDLDISGEQVNELCKLVDELKKTDSLVSRDSEEYKIIRNCLNALKTNSNENAVQYIRDNAIKYMKNRQNTKLSSRQQKRLAVINKILNVYEAEKIDDLINNYKSDNQKSKGEEIQLTDEQKTIGKWVAEEVLQEFATRLQEYPDKEVNGKNRYKNGRAIQTDRAVHNKKLAAIMNDKTFKTVISRYTGTIDPSLVDAKTIGNLRNIYLKTTIANEKEAKERAAAEKKLQKQGNPVQKAYTGKVK